MKFLAVGILVFAGLLEMYHASMYDPCPDGWAFFFKAQKCYKYLFGVGRVTFEKARELCQLKGGDVAIATDIGENNFIAFALTRTNIWLGGKRIVLENPTNVFQWTYRGQPASDSTKFQPAALIPWAAGRPRNNSVENCLYVNTNAQWVDVRCTGEAAVVCEKDILATTDISIKSACGAH